MAQAKDGEFLIESQVSDWEHDGDSERQIVDMKNELKEKGDDLRGLSFSYYDEYDYDCGQCGYVTVRGALNPAREKVIREVADSQ